MAKFIEVSPETLPYKIMLNIDNIESVSRNGTNSSIITLFTLNSTKNPELKITESYEAIKKMILQ